MLFGQHIRQVAMAGNKLINTLKYGSSRTKRKIYLMLAGLFVGVILMITAIALGNAGLALVGFLMLLFDGMLLFTSSFEERTVQAPERLKKAKREKKGKEQKESFKPAEDQDPSDKAEKMKKEENPLLYYDERELKRVMVAYKVKKHHVPVLIDMSRTEKISQCPAYVWKDRTYIYFLLFEEEPRMIKSPLADSREIHIKRGIPARPQEEYQELGENKIFHMIFGGLLPKYYEREVDSFRTEHRKNLYSAAPGIWCTSGSVKQLLKLLPESFVMDDGSLEGENLYYQEIYIARVLYWDGIYSGQEYKAKVLEVLDDLANDGISMDTVQFYLHQMMSKGLIPKEYADYVISKKSK